MTTVVDNLIAGIKARGPGAPVDIANVTQASPAARFCTGSAGRQSPVLRARPAACALASSSAARQPFVVLSPALQCARGQPSLTGTGATAVTGWKGCSLMIYGNITTLILPQWYS